MSSGDADEDRQRAVDLEERRVVEAPDDAADALARDRQYLVHLDLRDALQAISPRRIVFPGARFLDKLQRLGFSHVTLQETGLPPAFGCKTSRPRIRHPQLY